MNNEKEFSLPQMVNDIKDIHQKEKALFPADIASLAPARNYVADKLIKASLLKELNDDLSLFDSYKSEDEEQYLVRVTFRKLFSPTFSPIMPFLLTLGYIKYNKKPIFHLESYINNYYPIAVYAGSYLLLNGVSKFLQNPSRLDENIVRAKGDLHSCIVKLSNSLKYPDNELH